MNSQGVFYQQPNASDGAPLQPLEVTLFNPAYDKDQFESTSWTLNGKFGDLKAVYTGGYLVRNVDQVGDYTNYARGMYADYYQCYGPGAGIPAGTCYSPSATWHSVEKNEHQQHELRLSTPDDWRLRGIAWRLLGGQQALRPDHVDVQDHPAVHQQRDSRHRRQRQHRLPVERRHIPRHHRGEPRGTGRQHLLLSGPGARDQADRLLHLGRLRSHPEGADRSPPARASSGSTTPWRAACSRASAATRRACRPAAARDSSDRAASTSTPTISATPNPASRAAPTSPGTSRRTRWCTTPSRRASGPAASTRTAARRTPSGPTARRST